MNDNLIELVKKSNNGKFKWNTLQTLPFYNPWTSSCTVEKYTYIFGGMGSSIGDDYNRILYRFDMEDNILDIMLDNLPDCLAFNQCIHYNGNIYIIGGWASYKTSDNSKELYTVYKYNINDNSIERLNDMPLGIRNFAATLIGAHIYIFGGFSPIGELSSIYKYNIILDSWELLTATLPIASHYINSVADTMEENIYIFGDSGSNPAIYKYNIATNIAVKSIDSPIGIPNSQILLFEDNIYILTATKDILKYDYTKNTITTITDFFDGDVNGPITIYKDNIYIGPTSEDTIISTSPKKNFMIRSKSFKNIQDKLNIENVLDVYRQPKEWEVMDLKYPIILSTLYDDNAVVYNEYIYIFGGRSTIEETGYSYNLINKCYKINTKTNKIYPIKDMPYYSYGVTATLLGNDIYVIGGNGNISKLVYKYSILNDTWTLMPTLAPAYFCHNTSTLIGVDIYIIGNFPGQDTVFKYNTVNDTWTLMPNKIPTTLVAHASTVIGTDIYVIGGVTNMGSGVGITLDTVYKYNTLTDIWTLMTNKIPKPNGAHTSTLVGTDIYVICGDNGTTALDTIYKYNTLTDAWSLLDIRLPIPITSHTSALVGNYIYTICGDNKDGMADTIFRIPYYYLDNNIEKFKVFKNNIIITDGVILDEDNDYKTLLKTADYYTVTDEVKYILIKDSTFIDIK